MIQRRLKLQMVNISQNMKIIALKSKARRLYLKIQSRSDELSCGAHLADVIRPDIAEMEREFNSVMAKLRQLDSASPKERI
jgi:hypothetical protein